MLEAVDLDAEHKMLREDLRTSGSVAKRQKMAKRLKVIDAFRRSGVNPAWMIMESIPVLPPDLAAFGAAGRGAFRHFRFK